MNKTIYLFSVLFLTITNQLTAQCSLSNPDFTTIAYECPQDEIWITATIPFNGSYAKGRAFTKFGSGNNGQYKRPVILALVNFCLKYANFK